MNNQYVAINTIDHQYLSLNSQTFFSDLWFGSRFKDSIFVPVFGNKLVMDVYHKMTKCFLRIYYLFHSFKELSGKAKKSILRSYNTGYL